MHFFNKDNTQWNGESQRNMHADMPIPTRHQSHNTPIENSKLKAHEATKMQQVASCVPYTSSTSMAS